MIIENIRSGKNKWIDMHNIYKRWDGNIFTWGVWSSS